MKSFKSLQSSLSRMLKILVVYCMTPAYAYIWLVLAFVSRMPRDLIFFGRFTVSLAFIWSGHFYTRELIICIELQICGASIRTLRVSCRHRVVPSLVRHQPHTNSLRSSNLLRPRNLYQVALLILGYRTFPEDVKENFSAWRS